MSAYCKHYIQDTHRGFQFETVDVSERHKYVVEYSDKESHTHNERFLLKQFDTDNSANERNRE